MLVSGWSFCSIPFIITEKRSPFSVKKARFEVWDFAAATIKSARVSVSRCFIGFLFNVQSSRVQGFKGSRVQRFKGSMVHGFN
jgi:hypothetical protein